MKEVSRTIEGEPDHLAIDRERQRLIARFRNDPEFRELETEAIDECVIDGLKQVLKSHDPKREGPGGFDGYCSVVVRGRLRNEKEYRHRLMRDSRLTVSFDEITDADRTLKLPVDERFLLNLTMRELSKEERYVVTEHCMYGKSLTVISRELGLKGTKKVKVILVRAKRELRDHYLSRKKAVRFF